MSKFKGFSAKASREHSRIKLTDPRLTLKLEKYIATEFGKTWNQNCILVAHETEPGVVKLVIPKLEHGKFDDSKRRAKKSGGNSLK